MSSLSSVLNSCATLVTMDVWKRIAPHHSERRLVLVGQAATVLMVLFGLAWIPLMDVISSQIYVYLQSVQAYISPPIAAVFLIGVLWPLANALAALLTGLVLGTAGLVLELGETGLPGFGGQLVAMNFLHFAILLFLLCATVLVVVSLATRPPDAARVAPLTLRDGRPFDAPTRAADLALSAALAGLVVAAWLYFS